MKIGFFIKQAAISAALILLAACARSSAPKSLLETVKADCDIVIRTDLNLFLKSGGAESHGGVISPTDDMRAVSPRRPSFMLIERVAPLGAQVNLDTAVICAVDGRYYLTAWLRPGESLPMIQSKNDHSIYNSPCLSALVDGRQVWFALPGTDIMDELNMVRAHADDNTAASVPIFDSDELIEGFVKVDAKKNPAGEDFARIGIGANIFDRVITGNVCFFDQTNRQVSPFVALSDLSAMPRLLPSLGNMSIAAGMTPELKRDITRLATGELNLDIKLSANFVSGMLGDLEGDVFVTAVPGGNAETIRSFSADTWQMTALMPANDKTDAKSLRLLAKKAGMQARMNEDSTLIITNEGGDLDDVMERIAYEDVDEGTKALLRIEVPYNSQLQKALRLSHGFDAEICLTADEAQFVLSMRGGNGYIFPWIIETFASL